MRLGLFRLFRSQSDIMQFIQRAYPKIDWKVEKMAWSTLGWSNLQSFISELFPELCRAIDYFVGSRADLRFAITIPKHKLLIEYQGPASYADQIADKRPIITRTATESLVSLSERESFDLISIPFWWSRDKKSLLAEFWKERSDLFVQESILASWKNTALSAMPISMSIPLPEINRGYLMRWANDPRFEHLFK